MIRRPPRSTPLYSSAASDVYKRQSPLGGHYLPKRLTTRCCRLVSVTTRGHYPPKRPSTRCCRLVSVTTGVITHHCTATLLPPLYSLPEELHSTNFSVPRRCSAGGERAPATVVSLVTRVRPSQSPYHYSCRPCTAGDLQHPGQGRWPGEGVAPPEGVSHTPHTHWPPAGSGTEMRWEREREKGVSPSRTDGGAAAVLLAGTHVKNTCTAEHTGTFL